MLPSIWRNRGLASTSMDDFVERFFYGWPATGEATAWSPRADVHETEKEYMLDVELPGMEKKDIHVEVKNNVLTITGERCETHREKEKGYRSIERHFGRFERVFSLPDTIDDEHISAEYHNGVMTITLPKTEKALPKEISVEVK